MTYNNYTHKHVWQQQQFSIFIGPWRYRFRIFLCTQLLLLFDNPNYNVVLFRHTQMDVEFIRENFVAVKKEIRILSLTLYL